MGGFIISFTVCIFSFQNNTYVYKGAFVLNELNIDYEHSENKFGTITKLVSLQGNVDTRVETVLMEVFITNLEHFSPQSS